MKVLHFGNNAVTIELDPGDCFLLAEACRQTVSYAAATGYLILSGERQIYGTLAGVLRCTDGKEVSA